MRDYIQFFINGRPHRITGAAVFSTLSDFLRYDQGQTGTKVVCAEGDCGACTVLIGRAAGENFEYRAVNSCIQQLHQLDGTSVITVEGLGGSADPHPVQASMAASHGAQCGYCTPGFVMALAGALERDCVLSEGDVRAALTGNLCRCTGYEPIIKAGIALSGELPAQANQIYPPGPMLEVLHPDAGVPVRIEAGGRVFERPVDLREAARFKVAHGGVAIVQGGTDVGVQCNKRGFTPPAVLSLAGVEDIAGVTLRDGVMGVGGSCTLYNVECAVKNMAPEFHKILSVFGSPQIRNVGTLAGNIANGSPIADSLPFLFVMDAEIELTGVESTRRVPITRFYKGYKTFDMAPDEIISRIYFPLPKDAETLRLYKVSKRHDLDISAFTAGIRLTVTDGIIENPAVAYGGVGPVVLRLARTEEFLDGRPFSLDTFERAGDVAIDEITPISDVRGSKDFRLALARNILRKFCYEVAETGEPAWA